VRTTAIREFAEVLLIGFREGTPLFQNIAKSEQLARSRLTEDATFSIDFAMDGSNFGGLVATLDAIQLAVDAAAAAYAYRQTQSTHFDDSIDLDLLYSIASESQVSLEILYLNNGSVFGKIRARLTGPYTLPAAIAVGTLATVALSIAFPPAPIMGAAAWVLTSVTGATGLLTAGGAITDARHQEAQEGRIREAERLASEARQHARDSDERARQAEEQARLARERAQQLEDEHEREMAAMREQFAITRAEASEATAQVLQMKQAFDRLVRQEGFIIDAGAIQSAAVRAIVTSLDTPAAA
jgi:hypothetical protein